MMDDDPIIDAYLFYCWKPGRSCVYASVDFDDWTRFDGSKPDWQYVERTALIKSGPPDVLHSSPKNIQATQLEFDFS